MSATFCAVTLSSGGLSGRSLTATVEMKERRDKDDRHQRAEDELGFHEITARTVPRLRLPSLEERRWI